MECVAAARLFCGLAPNDATQHVESHTRQHQLPSVLSPHLLSLAVLPALALPSMSSDTSTSASEQLPPQRGRIAPPDRSLDRCHELAQASFRCQMNAQIRMKQQTNTQVRRRATERQRRGSGCDWLRLKPHRADAHISLGSFFAALVRSSRMLARE